MKQRFFYGWVVVVGCMILAASATGLLSYLNPLFVVPVTKELGVTRAVYMVYQTFSTTATVICMPLMSSLYKKVPMKVMIISGACLGAFAQFVYSFASSVRGIYLGGTLCGIATSMFGGIPIAILTTNWFYEKKGTATGIAFAGTGLVSALLSPIVSRIINYFGWRFGYRLIAVLILASVIPTVLFLIRETPEEMGLQPLGADKVVRGTAQKSEEETAVRKKAGLTRIQALTSKTFWIFTFAVFLLGALTAPAQQQMVAYWTDMGNGENLAAMMYSAVMTIAIFSKIFLGGIYDFIGVPVATAAVGGISVLSFWALSFCTRGYYILIPALLFGITVAVQVLVSTYVTNRLFGDLEYPFFYGIISSVLFGGAAVGSPVSAAIAEFLGSYQLVWIGFSILFALATILILLANRLSQREYKG